MKIINQATQVKFVMFEGEVLALFPKMLENNGGIVCYSHNGQHSSAGKNLMKCKKANKEQYAPLLNELKRQGYEFLLVLNEIEKVKKPKILSNTITNELEVTMIRQLKEEIADLTKKLEKSENKIEELENDFEEYKDSDNDELNNATNSNVCRGDFLESLKTQATNLKYKYYFKDIPDDIKTLITLISDINVHNDDEMDLDGRKLDHLPLLPL